MIIGMIGMAVGLMAGFCAGFTWNDIQRDKQEKEIEDFNFWLSERYSEDILDEKY